MANTNKIRPILDGNGNITYPLTCTEAVVDETGSLSSKLEAIQDQLDNYQPIEITGNVTNAPDEEDLTSENDLLKLKNRNSLNGYGYYILRRGNLVGSQMTLSNTIYEVRYNFDISEENPIEIPSGCILYFNGGSFIGGTLVGNQTYVNRLGDYTIFNQTTRTGTWKSVADINELSLQVSENTSDITSLDTRVSTNTGNISTNTTNISNLTSTVGTNTTDISNLNSSLTTLSNKVSNIADNEDLIMVSNKLKFKDRGTTDGMGKIILRKGIPLSQQMTQTNTIYVIQYDFTLDTNITIPSNCVLEFDGGSISGDGTGKDTITGNNTIINALPIRIFDSSISLSGTWNQSYLHCNWFGAKGDGVTDSTIAINNAIKIANSIKISKVLLSAGNYYITSTIYLYQAVSLIGARANNTSNVWGNAGDNSTIIIANFTETKAWIIDCWCVFKDTGLPYAYNAEPSANDFNNGRIITQFNVGVENITIRNSGERIYGGIRMINATGYHRKNINILGGVYNGLGCFSCFEGLDEDVRCQNVLYTDFIYANDVHSINIIRCGHSPYSGPAFTYNEDYISPTIKQWVYPTTNTYSIVFCGRYCRGLNIINFESDGRTDICWCFSACDDTIINGYWLEGHTRSCLYNISSTTTIGGFWNRNENIYYIESSGGTIVSTNNESINRCNIIANTTLKGFSDILNIDTYSTINNIYIKNNVFDTIKTLNLISNISPTRTWPREEKLNNVIIQGNNKTITTGFGVYPCFDIENKHIVVNNTNFDIKGIDYTTTVNYADAFNCFGICKFEFNNCSFDIGSNGFIFECVKELGSGAIKVGGKCIIDVVFNNCTFNCEAGKSYLCDSFVKIGTLVFIDTGHENLTIPNDVNILIE